MVEKIRVGILGAGWAGESHALAFSQLPHVEIAALWSRTRASAERLAGKVNNPGLKVYEHWQNLIEAAAVDVICVTTPPMVRREPVLMALEQGCHVLIEKPLSVGLADAQAMMAAAQAAETITATCFNWRYAPAYRAAYRVIREGRIGQIRDVRTEWCWRLVARDFLVQRYWLGRMDISDGLLGGGMSHDFDKMRYLTGAEFTEIVSQFADVTLKADDDFPVYGGAQMHMAKLSRNIMGSFRFTVAAGEDRWYCVLNGDEGSLVVNYGDALHWQRSHEAAVEAVAILPSEAAPAGVEMIQHGWNQLIADFVKAIRLGGVSDASLARLPTIVDGLRCQEVWRLPDARMSNIVGWLSRK